MLAVCPLGCSSSADRSSDSGPWGAEIEQARADATTQFEMAVLEDGAITRAEYDEAYSRLEECLSDAGVAVDIVQDEYGLYSVGVPSSREALLESCEDGSTVLVGLLYVSMTQNPANAEPLDAIAACINRHSLSRDQITASDLVAGQVLVPAAEIVDPAKPTAVAEYDKCFAMPSW